MPSTTLQQDKAANALSPDHFLAMHVIAIETFLSDRHSKMVHRPKNPLVVLSGRWIAESVTGSGAMPSSNETADRRVGR